MPQKKKNAVAVIDGTLLVENRITPKPAYFFQVRPDAFNLQIRQKDPDNPASFEDIEDDTHRCAERLVTHAIHAYLTCGPSMGDCNLNYVNYGGKCVVGFLSINTRRPTTTLTTQQSLHQRPTRTSKLPQRPWELAMEHDRVDFWNVHYLDNEFVAAPRARPTGSAGPAIGQEVSHDVLRQIVKRHTKDPGFVSMDIKWTNGKLKWIALRPVDRIMSNRRPPGGRSLQPLPTSAFSLRRKRTAKVTPLPPR